MADNLLDGRAISEEILEGVARRVGRLEREGVVPRLAFLRVGDDIASRVYVGMKEKAARRVGIESETIVLSDTVGEEDLLERIHSLNRNGSVHAILVQAPLPASHDPYRIYSAVSPGKDVDGFHPENMGKLLLGDGSGFVPCTPAGIQELLMRSALDLAGSHVVVLGRGAIVGKPLAALLSQKAPGGDYTVTLCHSRTRGLHEHCRRADVLVAAIGMPLKITRDMVREGAVVIDVGVNRIANPDNPSTTRLVGDVDFKEIQPVAGAITPNPGGVGPMTVAMLMHNTTLAAERVLARKAA